MLPSAPVGWWLKPPEMQLAEGDGLLASKEEEESAGLLLLLLPPRDAWWDTPQPHYLCGTTDERRKTAFRGGDRRSCLPSDARVSCPLLGFQRATPQIRLVRRSPRPRAWRVGWTLGSEQTSQDDRTGEAERRGAFALSLDSYALIPTWAHGITILVSRQVADIV